MSAELVDFGVRALVTLFAVVDPVGNLPVFVTTTAEMDRRARRSVAIRAMLVSAGVLAAFALGGTAVMWAFDLTLPAVRVAGGIVLLVIALQMLSGRQFHWERDRPSGSPAQADERAGVVPLAIPLMAGPGAMSSVIALTSQSRGWAPLTVLLGAIFLVCGLGGVLYLAAGALVRRLGRTVMVTISCLMGLILVALAVQFMLDGLAEAMPTVFRPR